MHVAKAPKPSILASAESAPSVEIAGQVPNIYERISLTHVLPECQAHELHLVVCPHANVAQRLRAALELPYEVILPPFVLLHFPKRYDVLKAHLLRARPFNSKIGHACMDLAQAQEQEDEEAFEA